MLWSCDPRSTGYRLERVIINYKEKRNKYTAKWLFIYIKAVTLP